MITSKLCNFDWKIFIICFFEIFTEKSFKRGDGLWKCVFGEFCFSTII